MNPIPTFWCEPTGRIRRFLRCYESNREPAVLPAGVSPGMPDVASHRFVCRSYCNAMRLLDEVVEEFGEPHDDGKRYRLNYDASKWPWDSFPTVCDGCGRPMEKAERQIFTDEVLVVKTGARVGQEFVRRELPVGAMFEITHYREFPDWCGWDGMALNIMCPGGEWHVDGRASNCTSPDDHRHRCWVRHGDPRTGYCHVDKTGTPERPTCAAGAGSIWQFKDAGPPREWHGHLYRGFLIDCGGQGAVDAILDPKVANPVAPAERVLRVHQIDRPVRVRPVVPPPVRVISGIPAGKTGWRSNRGFHARPKR